MDDKTKILQILKFEMRIRGYSEKSIESYIFHNEKFLKFIKKSPRDVNASDIKRYIAYLIDREKQRSSINLVISSLLFYYKNILKRKFDIKRMRAEKKLFPVLSKNEVILMFNAAENPKHNILLKLLYYTGVRVSEACYLKEEDIDFGRLQIHIKNGKGRKDRFIVINGDFKDDLKSYISKNAVDGYLFKTKKGHYSQRTVEKICKIYSRKAGIRKNITPHSLRRTFATHNIEDNVNIAYLQKQMGHSNINTTMNYIRYV